MKCFQRIKILKKIWLLHSKQVCWRSKLLFLLVSHQFNFDSGYFVGFRSLFDRKKEIDFRYFSRNDSLLKLIADHEDLQKLIRFSQQFYTVEKYSGTLVFNDLRFGQIIGWQKPREKFVFHYFLQHPEDNILVVQRGRFAKWDWNVAKALWKRIMGH